MGIVCCCHRLAAVLLNILILFEHTEDMEDGLPLTSISLVTVEWFNMVDCILLDYLVFTNSTIMLKVTLSSHPTMTIL